MLLLLLCSIPLVAAWTVNDMIGNGRWSVKKINKCPDADSYISKFEISTKKVNRTHDGFNFHGILDFELTNSHGIFIDACKYMDGGCKPYQTFADDCACCFMKKYAASNMQEVVALAGIDPPDCPIPKGKLDVRNFVFNYDALPEKGIFGTYDVKVFILQPKVGDEPPGIMACVSLTLIFDKDD